MLRKLRIFYNWIRGYGLGDPDRNGEYRFLRSYIAHGMVVFDVGAHIGDYTAYVMSLGRDVEVHCFEPVPSTYKKLRQRFTHHHQRTHVYLNHVGLSDIPGTAMMKIYGKYAGSNSLYDRHSALATHPSFASFRETEVQLTTLDAYLAETTVKQVDMLKIDVEGHEQGVLHGASTCLSSGRVHCVQFEYGGCFIDSGTTLKEVYQLLSKYGFKIFRLLPYGKIRVRSFDKRLENYQYSNWVALK